MTGTPIPQRKANKSIRPMNGFCDRILLRKPSASSPSRGTKSGVAFTSILPNDVPNAVIAGLSFSSSPLKFLYLAESSQIKRGCSSSRSERGSRPSFLATENRSSATADGDASAASLHQSGQAAEIAESDNLADCDNLVLKRCALSGKIPSFGILDWNFPPIAIIKHDRQF